MIYNLRILSTQFNFQKKKVFKHSSKQFLLKLWFVNRHVTEIESLSHIYIETKIAILQDK